MTGKSGITGLSGCTSDDEAGAHYALDDLVNGDVALYLVYQYGGSLFAHLMAALLNSCQHGVAGYGALAISETADSDILWHSESHVLGGIENANGRVIIDGKEAVGRSISLQYMRRDSLCIGTVIADICQFWIILQIMLAQGILVAIEAVLRYLHRHG